MTQSMNSAARDLVRWAIRGALSGLAIALAFAASLPSEPPGAIEANAFAAYVDGAGSGSPSDAAPSTDSVLALNR